MRWQVLCGVCRFAVGGLDRVGWAGAARVIGPERATAETQGRLERRQQNKQECLDRICNRAGRATVLLEATCGG